MDDDSDYRLGAIVMRSYKEVPLWKNVTKAQWDDWKWQLANRITTLEDLKQVINLTPEEEEGVRKSLKVLRMAISPYFAMLMDIDDPHDPIRMQAVPTIHETDFSASDMEDPLFEDIDSPVHGLTHRYPDRVLFLITDVCGNYCRHCTRRRFAGHADKQMDKATIDASIKYIKDHEEIRDVLLSGGDGLMVSDQFLEDIIKRLRAIDRKSVV